MHMDFIYNGFLGKDSSVCPAAKGSEDFALNKQARVTCAFHGRSALGGELEALVSIYRLSEGQESD